MSHRESHRILADELRSDRIDANLPVDPSHRERRKAGHWACPRCETQFRQGWQLRLHLGFVGACKGGVAA